jgi:hypothetical protein
MKEFFLGLLAALVLSGCTTVTVSPVKIDAAAIKHVCIENGEQMCFDGQMLGIIRDGFERHGIRTEVYTGNRPSECSSYLIYMCERTWDLATYMHHAELRLYSDNAQVGYAEYHLTGQGGLALTKFAGTKDKMDPVIDELLKDYPLSN